MVKRKYYPRKQEENIFIGTKKLIDSVIKAYDVGGMPLTLVIIGSIGFIFTFLLRTIMNVGTFIVMTIVFVLLLIGGIYIYLKEKKVL